MAYWGGARPDRPEGLHRATGAGESPGAFPAPDLRRRRASPRDRSARRSRATPTAPASTWPTGSTSSAAPSGPASRPSTTRPIRRATRSTSPIRPTSWAGSGWTTRTMRAACRRHPRATRRARPTPTPTWPQRQRGPSQHFGITDLADADIMIAQPPELQRPERAVVAATAPSTTTRIRARGRHLQRHPAGNRVHEHAVRARDQLKRQPTSAARTRSTAAPQGKLDGFSIVLGHEIHEAITDPGAEDVIGGSGLNNQTYLGGWYDPARRQRERRQVRVGRREPRHRIRDRRSRSRARWATSRATRRDVRGPVAVEQRLGRGRRLLRRRGNGPPDRVMRI